MTISMYQASVPVFIRMLNNLAAILQKAAIHAETKKIDPVVLINFRLYPDMLPFAKQIQIAADAAKNGIGRLERVRKTIEYLNTIKAEQIDGSEGKEIIIQSHGSTLTYHGQNFLVNRALPNLYFHITTAYAILRHNGVDLGKRDYLGPADL
jgi:hypothetical protein